MVFLLISSKCSAYDHSMLYINRWLMWYLALLLIVKLVSKIMSLSGICCVVHFNVLLSMLSLVEASLAFTMYLLK